MELRSSVTMSSQALKELLYGAKNNVQAIQEERPQSQLLSKQLQLKLAEGDYEVTQEKQTREKKWGHEGSRILESLHELSYSEQVVKIPPPPLSATNKSFGIYAKKFGGMQVNSSNANDHSYSLLSNYFNKTKGAVASTNVTLQGVKGDHSSLVPLGRNR